MERDVVVAANVIPSGALQGLSITTERSDVGLVILRSNLIGDMVPDGLDNAQGVVVNAQSGHRAVVFSMGNTIHMDAGLSHAPMGFRETGRGVLDILYFGDTNDTRGLRNLLGGSDDGPEVVERSHSQLPTVELVPLSATDPRGNLGQLPRRA